MFPPVPIAQTFITTLFDVIDANHPKPHGGVDFAVPVGTPIAAPEGGVVSRKFSDAGGGNVLELTHPSGLKTLYMHLSAYNVTQGQRVNAGDIIGMSGGAKGAEGSGHSTGPHLHFEVRDAKGNKLNPMAYITGVWKLSDNLAKMMGTKTFKGAASVAPVLLGVSLAGYIIWRLVK